MFDTSVHLVGFTVEISFIENIHFGLRVFMQLHVSVTVVGS